MENEQQNSEKDKYWIENNDPDNFYFCEGETVLAYSHHNIDRYKKLQAVCDLLNSKKESRPTEDTIQRNKDLEHHLSELIDATLDKNGQFRAWHQHLKTTTIEAQKLLK